jgi:hypothetical protein
MAIRVNDKLAIGAVMRINRIEGPCSIRTAQPRAQGFFRTWFGLLLLGFVLCGWADPMNVLRRRHKASGSSDEVGLAQRSSWKLVGSHEGLQGREQFVLVKKTSVSDEKSYDDAIKHLCPVDEWCGLDFWSDSSQIPSHLPMSDLQTAAEVANFTRDPATGFSQFVWNCRVHNDPLNCFSYQ